MLRVIRSTLNNVAVTTAVIFSISLAFLGINRPRPLYCRSGGSYPSCVALLLLSYGSRLLDHMFCFQIGLVGRNQQPRERPTSPWVKTVRVQDILLYIVLYYVTLFVIAKDIMPLFVFSYLLFFPFSQCTYNATTFKVPYDMYNLEERTYFYNLIYYGGST